MSNAAPLPEDGVVNAETRKELPGAVPAAVANEPVFADVLTERRPAPPAGPRFWVTILVASLVSALVSGLVSTIVVLVTGGGESGSGKNIRARGPTSIREGKLDLAPQSKQEVYCPIPFEGPPHLEIEGDQFHCVKLVEQKADHFLVHNDNQFSRSVTIRWHAEGLPRRN